MISATPCHALTAGVLILGHQSRQALVMDAETGIPVIDTSDAPFQSFEALCSSVGFTLRVLGSRQAAGPGFPGPLRIVGVARQWQLLEALPAAEMDEDLLGAEQAVAGMGGGGAEKGARGDGAERIVESAAAGALKEDAVTQPP
jgi:hypothetical protein